eukprot:766203-Hanusia_phi.AAC.4
MEPTKVVCRAPRVKFIDVRELMRQERRVYRTVASEIRGQIFGILHGGAPLHMFQIEPLSTLIVCKTQDSTCPNMGSHWASWMKPKKSCKYSQKAATGPGTQSSPGYEKQRARVTRALCQVQERQISMRRDSCRSDSRAERNEMSF